MERDHYVLETERQLNDSTFYKLFDHDPTVEFVKQLSGAVRVMHEEGHISEKNMAYLIVVQPKARIFYLLPKIYKAGNAGRPISCENGHQKEKIFEFVYLHLQAHLQTLPSYLQDTTEFLKKQYVLGPFRLMLHLFLWTVHPFYNIPHIDAMPAWEAVLEERDINDPSTQTLVKILTLVLKCDNL